MKKIFFISFGISLTIFGFIGIFLPLLPTTPLLLAAAFFFARSSPKFYCWLMNNRFCGKYLTNYTKYKGMRCLHKVKTISFLWITIGFTIFLVIENFYIITLLLIIAVAVSTHILLLKTITDKR